MFGRKKRYLFNFKYDPKRSPYNQYKCNVQDLQAAGAVVAESSWTWDAWAAESECKKLLKAYQARENNAPVEEWSR